MKMQILDISDIEGFRLGNAENTEKGTGCTVIVCEEGAVGGVDVRGGGPATRETDLLRSENTVNAVNAVVLSGGSAFGLEAASGVMRELADRGVGFEVGGDIRVPIVCGASLFDLPVGDAKAFPDVNMGIQAVRRAYDEGGFAKGNHGAGTGATVGKITGYERAMKSGLGTFACGDDYIQVGAIAAVNACGDIYNGAGNIIAGLRTEDGQAIYGTIKALKNMVHDQSDAADDNTLFISRAEIEAALAAAAAGREDEIPEPFLIELPAEKDDVFEEAEVAGEPLIAAEAEPEIIEPVTEEESSSELVSEEATEDAEAAEGSAVEEVEQISEAAAGEDVREEILETGEPAITEETDEPAITAEAEAAVEPLIVEEARVLDEVVAAEPVSESAAEEEPPKPLTREEMGYNITFNTTIGCLITNAVLTKSQANKLASILHDAYARAIKPVHSTLDGDTIFVLTTGRQQVNFDAFAALATDVMQYAVIDGAMSAESAYGLPAAKDIKRVENHE